MSATWCQAPIHLELRPSRQLTAFHLLSHGGAVAALWYAALPPPAAWVLTVLVVLHGLWVLHREWSPAHPRRVRRLVSLPDGGWRLVTAAGEDKAARLAAGGLVHPRLTVLAMRFEDEWGTHGVVLTTDNVPARPFRRLRVRLLLAERAAPA